VTAVAPPLVSITGLHKEYQGLRPLRMRAFHLHAGDVVALAGLDERAAEILVGLLTGAALPDQGEVRLFEQATSSITDTEAWLALLDRVGLVTTRAVLIEPFTVRQNLALPFTIALDPVPAEWIAKVDDLAREAGIPEAQWDRPVGHADADTQARVRVARALALDPAVLLVEHPTATMPRDRVPGFGVDLGRLARARQLALLAITADEEFARALEGTRLTHQPVTGECQPSGFWSKILGR